MPDYREIGWEPPYNAKEKIINSTPPGDGGRMLELASPV